LGDWSSAASAALSRQSSNATGEAGFSQLLGRTFSDDTQVCCSCCSWPLSLFLSLWRVKLA
jgi:hypothetical protein